MKNPYGPILGLTVVIVLTFSQNSPSLAQVIVNNVLSPFTAIEVGPAHSYGRSGYYYSYRGYGSYDTAYYPRRYREQSPGYAPAGAYCWHSTDPDRGYGYWGRCGRRGWGY